MLNDTQFTTLTSAVICGLPNSEIGQFCADQLGTTLPNYEIVALTKQVWDKIRKDSEISTEDEAARNKLRLDMLFNLAVEAKDFSVALATIKEIKKGVTVSAPKNSSQQPGRKEGKLLNIVK